MKHMGEVEMDIYLKSGKEEIRLPVIPGSYELQTKYNHSSAQIVTFGEASVKGTRGLDSFSISSFFPGSRVHGGYKTKGEFRSPLELVNKIKKWADRKSVVRVIITGTNVNEEFLITDFSHGESDATGDVNYSISFSQYRLPKVTESGTKNALKKRSEKKLTQTVYTVRSGETLKSIAKKFFGSSDKFRTLAKLNHISAPYKVKSGQVILLR